MGSIIHKRQTIGLIVTVADVDAGGIGGNYVLQLAVVVVAVAQGAKSGAFGGEAAALVAGSRLRIEFGVARIVGASSDPSTGGIVIVLARRLALLAPADSGFAPVLKHRPIFALPRFVHPSDGVRVI